MNRTLPQRMYLLNYDAEKEVIGPAQFRGHLMRSAALTELATNGLLSGKGSKVASNTGKPPSDPFLAKTLQDISPDKPRYWITVVQLNAQKAEAAVREQLVATGEITDQEGKTLGVLPTHHVTVNKPEQALALQKKVRNAVLIDPATVPMDEVVMTMLAADGEIGPVFGWRERREHKRALKALGERFDEAVPGLRKAFLAANASARSYGGGW